VTGHPLHLHRLVDVPSIAAATGVSERTVRRWCAIGKFEDAYQPAGPRGSWYVPVYGLVAAGLVAEMAEMADDERPPEDPGKLRV
jgi:hypothetical protein